MPRYSCNWLPTGFLGTPLMASANLTNRVIDNLELTANCDYFVWDTKLKGFGIRVTERTTRDGKIHRRKVFLVGYRPRGSRQIQAPRGLVACRRSLLPGLIKGDLEFSPGQHNFGDYISLAADYHHSRPRGPTVAREGRGSMSESFKFIPGSRIGRPLWHPVAEARCINAVNALGPSEPRGEL
jgi:hypothetical protein